jgi:hypothetical protein
MEPDSLVLFHRLRPSLSLSQVGSCIRVFEACSAFTHVTACTLAESPSRPFPPEAPAASLPPPLLRLLPGGANQFPGGTFTRCRPSPFHGALREFSRVLVLAFAPDGTNFHLPRAHKSVPALRRPCLRLPRHTFMKTYLTNSPREQRSRSMCAGINRHEVENERVLRERSSEPLGPEFWHHAS